MERRRPARRHRRHDPQPRGRGDEAARDPGHRRAGLRAHARRARGADRGARRAAGLEARAGEGHQVRPRRRDPRRRARARHGDGGGRLRRHRGDRGRPARGRLLRAAARRATSCSRTCGPSPSTTSRTASATTTTHDLHVWTALAGDVRRPRGRRAPRLRPRGARAALGRLPAARHRRGGELRRPPPPLALPDPQRRPARLQPARADPDRADRPLPPQGRAGRLRAGRPERSRATTNVSSSSAA